MRIPIYDEVGPAVLTRLPFHTSYPGTKLAEIRRVGIASVPLSLMTDREKIVGQRNRLASKIIKFPRKKNVLSTQIPCLVSGAMHTRTLDGISFGKIID